VDAGASAAMHLVRKYNPFKRPVVAGTDSPRSAAVSPTTGARRQSATDAASGTAAGKRSNKAEKELQHLSCKIVSHRR